MSVKTRRGTESLKQRIKNFLVGTNTHNERTRKKIKDALEKLSGYKIAAGHIADGIDIVVKDVQKVIRTRNAYDYEKILPEVGGKIAEKLNLNPTAEMKNYIAEWIMTGAPNNTSAEAKSFQRAMNANDDFYREQLIDLRNIFQAETKKDIWEQLRGRIAYERGEENKSISEKAKSKWRELYEQFVEELQPVQDLVESVEKEIGRKLKPNENPMTALRLYRGAAGIAKIMIEGESKFVKQALQNEFPNLKFENFGEFKTMFNILKDIGALEDEEKIKNFKPIYRTPPTRKKSKNLRKI